MKNAFTLLELLVVIAIIAVLAAMLMASINVVRSSAHTSVCANNRRGIGVGFLAFASENDSVLPWGENAPAPQPYSWSTALNSLDSGIKMTCPAAEVKGGTRHFTANINVLALRPFGSGPYRAVHTTELRSGVAMLFDAGLPASGNAFYTSQNMGNSTFYFLDRAGLAFPKRNDDLLPAGDTGGTFRIYNRHSGMKKCNILFGDGHVQCVVPTTLYNRDFRINANGRRYW